MNIKCSAIIYSGDNLILVKKIKTSGDFVVMPPHTTLSDTDDLLQSVRSCILTQTGYKPQKMCLFKVLTERGGPDKPNTINFVFGCEVTAPQHQVPKQEVVSINPIAAIKFAMENKLQDKPLIRLLTDYHNNFGVWLSEERLH